jgi:soluble lytic murein transglycosylase-like protein
LDPVKGLIIAASAAAIGLSGTMVRAQAVAQFDQETAARLQVLQPFIDEASDRFGIPDAWILAVISAESGGRTTVNGRPITSRAGAKGPMQVMPRTYDELRLRYGLGPDPADPEQNILAGTAYLKELYERFGHAGMFAAYNAGPKRYKAYLDGSLPLPEETRAYLSALGNVVSGIAAEATFISGRNLFFPLSSQDPESAAPQRAPNSDALFVPLNPPEPDPSAEKRGH